MCARFITMKQLREEHEEWFRPSEVVITKKNLTSTKRELLERIRELEEEADCLAERLACHNPNCDCGFDVKYWRNWARDKRERQASTK